MGGAFGGVALDGGGWSPSRCDSFTPQKEVLVPIGWFPERVLILWSGEKTRTGTGNKIMISRLSNP
jgi:hypothetical protein